MNRTSGFTLLEVLVAMSIFAVIGLSAHQMLRTVIQTHERTQDQIQQFSSLTRAFSMLERDFSQVVLREVRDEYGERLPALMVATGPFLVELSRSGWNNPLRLPRSDLQRVAYELNDEGEVIRYFWLVLDRAEDSEPVKQTILTGIDDFQINLMDADGNVTDIWPDTNSSYPLPTSVEVVFDTTSYGSIRKVFDLVDAAVIQATNSTGGNNGDPGTGDAGSDEGDINTTSDVITQ